MNCENIINTPTLQSPQMQGNIAFTDQLKDRFILLQAVREHARPSLKNRRYLAEREERETSVGRRQARVLLPSSCAPRSVE